MIYVYAWLLVAIFKEMIVTTTVASSVVVYLRLRAKIKEQARPAAYLTSEREIMFAHLNQNVTV